MTVFRLTYMLIAACCLTGLPAAAQTSGNKTAAIAQAASTEPKAGSAKLKKNEEKKSEAPETEDVDPNEFASKVETRIDDDMVEMETVVEALSKTLGQLHSLRTLCFSDEDQHWRDIAANMMKHEAKDDAKRRKELIKAFNTGYYEQEERYQTCSANVSIDVAALAENGRRLAVMLGDPYHER